MNSSKNQKSPTKKNNNLVFQELLELWKQIDKGRRNSLVKSDLKKKRDSSAFFSIIENISKKKHWSIESAVSSPNLFKFICEELDTNSHNYHKEISLFSIQYIHKYHLDLFDEFLQLTETEIPGGNLDKAECNIDGSLEKIKSITKELVDKYHKKDIKFLYLAINTFEIKNLNNLTEIALNYLDEVEPTRKSDVDSKMVKNIEDPNLIEADLKLLDESFQSLKVKFENIITLLNKDIIPVDNLNDAFELLKSNYDQILKKLYIDLSLSLTEPPGQSEHNYDLNFLKAKFLHLREKKSKVHEDINDIFISITGLNSKDLKLDRELLQIKKDLFGNFYQKYLKGSEDELQNIIKDLEKYKSLLDLIKRKDKLSDEKKEELHNHVAENFSPSLAFQILFKDNIITNKINQQDIVNFFESLNKNRPKDESESSEESFEKKSETGDTAVTKDELKAKSKTDSNEQENKNSLSEASLLEEKKRKKEKPISEPIKEIKDSFDLIYVDKGGYQKVFEFLNNDMFEAAYYLNYCINSNYTSNKVKIPNWLLESLILSFNIQESSGEISNQLKNIFEFYDYREIIDDSSLIWNDCMNLLLFSTASLPSLKAPVTGAVSILADIKFNSKLESLFNLIQKMVEFSTLGYSLDKNYMQVFHDSYDVELNRKELKSEVEDWYKRIRNKNINYPPARRILRFMTDQEGLISQMIYPILNNITDIGKLNKMIKQYSDDDFEKEIELTSRNVNTRKEKIDGLALNVIITGLKKADSFSKQWLQINKPSDKSNFNFISIKAKELRDSFNTLVNDAKNEVKKFQKSKDVLTDTTGKIALKVLDNLGEFFNPSKNEIKEELSINEYYEQDWIIFTDELWFKILDRIYDNKLNKVNFEKFLDLFATDKQISKRLYEELLTFNTDLSYYGLFSKHCTTGNHILTEKLINRILLKNDSGITREKLEEERSDSIKNHKNKLNKNILTTKNIIEIGLTEDLLTESQRAEYLSLVNSINLDSDYNYGYCNYLLSKINDAVDKLKDVKKNKLLDRITSDKVKTSDKRKISNLINANKLATAQSFLESIERGESFYELPDEQNKLENFLSSIKNNNEYLARFDNKQVNLFENIKKLGKASAFGSIKPPPTKPQLYSLQDVLKSWFTIKFDRDVRDFHDLSNILKWLGFYTEPENIVNFSVDKNVPGNYKWYNFSTENMVTSPIPMFGSLANKNYKLLSVFQGESIAKVIEIIKNQRSDKALLVFNFWRIDEKGRRILCKTCYENKVSVVVIDDLLMMYLANQIESNRTSSLFEIALPFCYSLPFVIAAGHVPSEMFFGRKKILEDILNPTGACIIYGGRQLGKTAILRKLEKERNDPEKGQYIVFLDLKAKGFGITNQNPEYIWQLIGNELAKQNILKNRQWKSFEQFDREIKEWLKHNLGSRLLLLLDEADKFIEIDSNNNLNTLTQLRGLMDDTNSKFKFVLSGLHNVQRFTKISNSTISHLLTRGSHCIGPLIADGEQYEAVKLIVSPFRSLGYKFENEEIVYKILNHTNYYPSLIQLFCDNLLREMYDQINHKFDTNQNPPFTIGNDNIDDVYSKRQKLRKDIVDRFQWTLNLDPRYELIAYLISYLSYENTDLARDGLSINNVLDEATKWKKGLFLSDNKFEDVRDILDEMIGLGILRKTEKNNYSLKDSNIFRLLGTIEDIERKLISIDDKPPAIELEMESYRKTDLAKGYELSTFTAKQETLILKPENAVVLVSGIGALGLSNSIHYLDLALKDLPIKSDFEKLQSHINTTQAFQRKLDNFLDSRNLDLGIFVIPDYTLWNESWIKYALEKINSRRSKNFLKKVIFLADGSQIWSLYVQSRAVYEELIKAGLKEIRLRQISNSMLNSWLRDNMIKNKEEIQSNLGLWPGLYNKFLIKTEANLVSVINPFDDTNKKVFEENMNYLVKAFGIEIDSNMELVKKINDFGEPISIEELYLWCENNFPLKVLEDILEWGKYFSIITQDEQERFSLDPIVSKVVKNKDGK